MAKGRRERIGYYFCIIIRRANDAMTMRAMSHFQMGFFWFCNEEPQ